MCIAAFSFNPYTVYPLILGFNRDEYYFRGSSTPGQYWDTDTILAPKDNKDGGTWIGTNYDGLVCCILNKYIKSTNEKKKVRSRGLLVLDVLKQKRIENAVYMLTHENLSIYRPFSLLLFDKTSALVISNYDNQLNLKFCISSVRPGVHLISHTYLDDANHPRISNNMERNSSIDYSNTNELLNFLRSSEYAPNGSMIQKNKTWGTVSTSIIKMSKNGIDFNYYKAKSKTPLTYNLNSMMREPALSI